VKIGFFSEETLGSLKRKAVRHGLSEDVFNISAPDEDVRKFLDKFLGSSEENGRRERLKNCLLNYADWKKPFAATIFKLNGRQVAKMPNAGKKTVALFEERKNEMFGLEEALTSMYEDRLVDVLVEAELKIGKGTAQKILQDIFFFDEPFSSTDQQKHRGEQVEQSFYHWDTTPLRPREGRNT